MENDNIVKLSELQTDENKKPLEKKTSSRGLHTNPILERMFFSNILNKKNKFKLKDLFNNEF